MHQFYNTTKYGNIFDLAATYNQFYLCTPVRVKLYKETQNELLNFFLYEDDKTNRKKVLKNQNEFDEILLIENDLKTDKIVILETYNRENFFYKCLELVQSEVLIEELKVFKNLLFKRE